MCSLYEVVSIEIDLLGNSENPTSPIDSVQIVFHEVEVWKKNLLFGRELGNHSCNAGRLIPTRLGELDNTPSSYPVEEID